MSLKAENLRKSFKKRCVVDDVSISVDKGEIVGLLGPNGAGKTTTFYMMVGIVRPDGGKVFLDGDDVTKKPIHVRCRQGIGYLPQEPSVYRRMSVYDNIASTVELKISDRKQIKDRTSSLVRDFGLEKVKDSKGYALSGGERRRVEIARCMAADPKVILLDEPFSGIDPISVTDIQKMIFNLKNLGIGVLITDHNVRETLKIVDRAYIIAEGNVLTHGRPEDVVANEQVIKSYLGEEFTL